MEIGFDLAFPFSKTQDIIFPLWNIPRSASFSLLQTFLSVGEIQKRTSPGYQNHNIKVKRILIYSPNVLGRQTVTFMLIHLGVSNAEV